MIKHASLCILSYKRPNKLKQCIDSIRETADYPHTIIVNSDGLDDKENYDYLSLLYRNNLISNLILTCGYNRGVGRAFSNCLGLCEGEYIFKIDTDLTFKKGWLSTACAALERHEDVGAVSLFNYRHYDPNDSRFNILETRETISIVDDFVSSIYAFRAKDIGKMVPIEDDGNHTKLGMLAITSKDYVINSGFGVGKSVYVSGTMDHPYKTPTFSSPLIFHSS